VGPEEFDLHRFDAWQVEGDDALERGRLGQAGAAFRAALALWRGGALEGIPSGTLTGMVVPGLEERRLAVLEECVDVELRLGRHAGLVAELDAWVRSHPSRERLQGQLMLALYRSGRQTDALEVYRRARQWLVDEFGLEPGPNLRHLEQAILMTDPALDPPEAPVTVRASAPAAVPGQLPPDLPDFTGWESVVHQLYARLTRRDAGRHGSMTGVSIIGPPGIGKTALAVHLSHLARPHFPDGQFFVDLQGVEQRSLDAGVVLLQFLRALGVARDTIPDDPYERAGLFRALLADRRMLVVLDNAADETQVRPLLPGGEGCAVVVTSRQPLPGLEVTRSVHLDVPSAEAAVTLLGRIVGARRVAVQAEDAQRIAELCGFLPLAVRIAGARLAVKPHWPLSRLAVLLTDERSRLDELAVGDLEVRASLLLSYRSLDEPQRCTLRLLGLIRSASFSAWPAAALLGVRPAGAEALIEELVNGQLVEAIRADLTAQCRYRFHDLTRAFARERLQQEETPQRKEAAAERLVRTSVALADWAVCCVEQGRPEPSVEFALPDGAVSTVCDARLLATVAQDPFSWFDDERAMLVDLVDHAVEAGLVEPAWRLARSLAVFFEVRGHWDCWLRTHEVALAAARLADRRDGEAAMRCGLGQLAVDRGRFDDALAQLYPAEEIARQVGDAAVHAGVLCCLGDAHAGNSRHDDAVECYQSAVVISRDRGDRPREVASLRGLGLSYREQGRFSDAVACLQRALVSIRSGRDRRLEPWTLTVLGLVHLDQDHFDDAAACFAESVSIATMLGDPRARVYAKRGLGDALRGMGRLAEAERQLREALAEAESFNDDLGQFQALRRLGDVYQDMDRLDDALNCLHDALRIVRRARTHCRLEAEALCSLGYAHHARGALAEATDALERSLSVFRQCGLTLARARAASELSLVLDRRGQTLRAAQREDAVDAGDGVLHPGAPPFAERIRTDRPYAQPVCAPS
jgi:tetratricopeptide (TPR) repeat protein